MSKLFTTSQITEIDRLTILKEPVADIDLMERASMRMAGWMYEHLPENKILWFFVGPGNNGGDALAVARMMADRTMSAGRNYACRVFLACSPAKLKGSPAVNLSRLQKQDKVDLEFISSDAEIPEKSIEIPDDVIVIDGLFGSGLNRKVSGPYRKIIDSINRSHAAVISIDIPSGLFGEDNSKNDLSGIVKADYTLTLEFPKICFFFPEHEDITGKITVLPIGLHPKAIDSINTSFFHLDRETVRSKRITRKIFSNKGTYGHALLIAGSEGKAGAAILSAEACLRGGAGLLTVHLPRPLVTLMQSAVPEAMCSADPSDTVFSEVPDCSRFSAIGAGPGIGRNERTAEALKNLLQKTSKLVLDADALNIISDHPELLNLLPENTILTPHPKEFERLAGKWEDSWTRLCMQRDLSKKYKVIVVLKDARTSISLPNGEVWFNTTGNPGMATAGSGDVLTGLILGLLAQQYSPKDAALTAVYLHGRAGDLAEKETGQEALLSGDLPHYFGKAFLELE
ncbi:MAG: NAD(P)H-hydrate dehydratase [Bacteroidales bacterium]|jgi:NAD(P)H-hydrate epimerase|nr:NAD(P)H-hydrate dehydratase [Bacteroidales bacterium]